MTLKERAEQLKIDIPAVFLALKAKETPWTARFFAALTIIYALSPIDLIPDFIPVIGYLDDLIILPAGKSPREYRLSVPFPYTTGQWCQYHL